MFQVEYTSPLSFVSLPTDLLSASISPNYRPISRKFSVTTIQTHAFSPLLKRYESQRIITIHDIMRELDRRETTRVDVMFKILSKQSAKSK